MGNGIKVTVEKKELVIRLPIAPKESSSGKNTVIASTRGNHKTGVKWDGKEITVGVNAYVPID